MVWLGYVSVCCIVGGFKGTPLTQRRKRWSFCDSPKSGRGFGPERRQGYPGVLFRDGSLSTNVLHKKLELIEYGPRPIKFPSQYKSGPPPPPPPFASILQMSKAVHRSWPTP